MNPGVGQAVENVRSSIGRVLLAFSENLETDIGMRNVSRLFSILNSNPWFFDFQPGFKMPMLKFTVRFYDYVVQSGKAFDFLTLDKFRKDNFPEDKWIQLLEYCRKVEGREENDFWSREENQKKWDEVWGIDSNGPTRELETLVRERNFPEAVRKYGTRDELAQFLKPFVTSNTSLTDEVEQLREMIFFYATVNLNTDLVWGSEGFLKTMKQKLVYLYDCVKRRNLKECLIFFDETRKLFFTDDQWIRLLNFYQSFGIEDPNFWSKHEERWNRYVSFAAIQ